MKFTSIASCVSTCFNSEYALSRKYRLISENAGLPRKGQQNQFIAFLERELLQYKERTDGVHVRHFDKAKKDIVARE